MNNKRFDKLMLHKFKPVLHTTEDNARLLSPPKVRTAYDTLEDDYAELEALLKARTKAGITQEKLRNVMH
jgi:hypothetical protein